MTVTHSSSRVRCRCSWSMVAGWEDELLGEAQAFAPLYLLGLRRFCSVCNLFLRLGGFPL